MLYIYIYICVCVAIGGKNRETILSSLQACFVKYIYILTAFNKDSRRFQDRIVKGDVVFLW